MSEVTPTLAGLKQWWLDQAVPLWLTHGIDRVRGAFHESLDPLTMSCPADFRRLRVAARQTYVFAHATHEGVRGAEEAVYLGLDFLQRHAALGDGGFAWRFDLANRAVDLTRDLYDHAFVLLAFAASSGIMPREPVHDAALNVLSYVQANLAHPAGGFAESLPAAAGPRRQNPHMHLLEALLLAAETFGDMAFLEAAHPIIALLRRHFYVREARLLAENFGEDLVPQAGADGALWFEPGHHCEWVWLLDWYQRFTGADAELAAISQTLLARAHAAGGRFGLPAVVSAAGAVADGPLRLWPQTELLKAEAVQRQGDGPLPSVAVLAGWLRADGFWAEYRDAQSGAALPGPVPASSLYHLTSAILTTEEIMASEVFETAEAFEA